MLKILLDLLNFGHIQQINLIKILFLTGAIGVADPNNHVLPKEDMIQVDNMLICYETCLTKLQERHIISDEVAEKILNKAEFSSVETAFKWLNDIMQKKFFRGSRERHEVEDLFQNSEEYVKLLQDFHFTSEIKLEGYFDYIIVPGSTETFFKKKSLFLTRLLNENLLETNKIYLITSERYAYPYIEPGVESILAQRMSIVNQKNIKDNLAIVKNIFVKIAQEYLRSKNINNEDKMENIRSIFRKNPALFNINLLIDNIIKDPQLKGIKWPTETDIVMRIVKKMFKKYRPIIIETPNKIIDGRKFRGNSRDAVNAWLNWVDLHNKNLNITSDPGSKPKILLVSHQPKASYQLAVFENMLSDKYQVEMIASPNYGNPNISLLLSELAARIYEGKNLLKNKGR